MSYHKLSPRLRSFKIDCNNKGIDINYDDLRFIDLNLMKFHSSEYKGILSDYLLKWAEGMDGDKKAILKQNLGRFLANSWLRELSLEKNKKKI